MRKNATDQQPADADLGGQLRSAVGRLYRRFRSERPEGGLGDAALDVLTRLHKHGPQTLTELSEHDRVSPASMSQTVNRLTSAGYAVRTRDPGDGRKVLFSATAEGHELASAARAQRNAWLDERLRALSAEDRAVIARATALLSGIADSCQPLRRPYATSPSPDAISLLRSGLDQRAPAEDLLCRCCLSRSLVHHP